MNRWKIITKTEIGDFIAKAETEEAAKRLAAHQKRKGGWECTIEEIDEERNHDI